jgi:hypothetical protein
MAYQYLVFRTAYPITFREEISVDTIIPFVSNNAILMLLRQAYPETRVNKEGIGWLNPRDCTGEIRLSEEDSLVFHLTRMTRADVKALCKSLGLTALDLHRMELITPHGGDQSL